MDVNIRVAGQAGQGVHTVGDLLVQVLAATGRHVFATQSYMSRIRGGLNWYDVRVADRELFAGRQEADLLVALTPEALVELAPRVTPGGLVLIDGPTGAGAVPVEFTRLAKEIAGSAVMANAVAAGAIFAVLGYELGPLETFLSERFAAKGDEVGALNVACARRGAAALEPWTGSLDGPPPTNAEPFVADGSSAVGLAAATAGVKVVCSYPMTPSTGVFTYLAAVADDYGIVVEQAEDEIAAINMVCGATYAGVPALTTTSGGGFALMAEGLSLAGMLELPAVIVLAMRPGPATGLPTRTGQEDLLFAIHAGHGEFPRAVFAPGTLHEAYWLTRHAIAVAHRYQTPAIVLLDQFLADAHRNGPQLERQYRPVDRCLEEKPPAGYLRYALTESGVSPRAIPGGPALVVVDSDEHTEDGHLTERLDVRRQMVEKRLRKQAGLQAEALPPTTYGAADADLQLVCWGSTYGPCREAVDLLAAQGTAASMVHFSQVWPLQPEVVRAALRAKQIVVVEGNAGGQFASLLAQIGVGAPYTRVARYDGLPFTGEQIAGEVST